MVFIMVELPKIKIRKNKDGILLDADGEKVFAFQAHNPKTGSWDITHYLGEKDTLDENGNISDYFGNALPNEDSYAYNIVRAVVVGELKSTDITPIKFFEMMDDFFVGTFKHGKKSFIIAFKFGEDFDSDEFDIKECVET